MSSKCAVVTGGASGIGKAIAEALKDGGMRVVIADRNAELGVQVAGECGFDFLEVDLGDRESCRKLIERAATEYGGVDILVNNAGFQHVSPLEEFCEDTWDTMMRVMLTAPFLLTRYAWPHMKEKGWGRVINMSSIHGQVASPNKSGYISAKHGLVGLTKTAALEGGPFGITVNAICPAYVRTPLVEGQIADQAKHLGISESEVEEQVLLKASATKRLIEPDEVAGLVTYLCSDAAKSITGTCQTIDGGWTAQ